MAKGNNNQTEFESKAERSRAEREERLEKQRAKDGSHKPLEKKSGIWKKILLAILVILLIIVVVLVILWQTGTIQRNLIAANVNGESVSINEYNYEYNALANTYNNYFGQGGLLDPNEDSSNATKQDLTWGEFFEQTTEKNIKQSNILYKEAKEAGYELDEEQEKQTEAYINATEQQMGSPLNMETYLKNVYGKGMTIDALRQLLNKKSVISQYVSERPAEFEVSEEEINEEYESSSKNYDVVNYHSFVVNSEIEDENGDKLTGEDLQKAKDEAEKKAEDAVANISSEKDLPVVAKEFADYEEETLNANVSYATVGNTEIADWLFSEDRENGDVDFFENGDNYQVVFFVDRAKDERNVADIRLLTFAKTRQNGTEYTDDQLERIRKNANNLAATAKNEDDILKFGENNKDNEIEAIANAQSVKYEDINSRNVPGLQKEVLDYVLSEQSNAGDTEMIETDTFVYVVHIIEKKDQTSTENLATKVIQQKKFEEDLEQKTNAEENDLKKRYPGIWLVKTY